MQFQEVVLIHFGYQIKNPYFCAGFILLTRITWGASQAVEFSFYFLYTQYLSSTTTGK